MALLAPSPAEAQARGEGSSAGFGRWPTEPPPAAGDVVTPFASPPGAKLGRHTDYGVVIEARSPSRVVADIGSGWASTTDWPADAPIGMLPFLRPPAGLSVLLLCLTLGADMSVATVPPPPVTTAELRARYRHLVWSNPDAAPDGAFRAAALRGGRFLDLLDFTAVFGLEAMRDAWSALRREEPAAAARCAPAVTRILTHLDIAIRCAQSRHPTPLGTAAA